jgi:hypothetical protein
MGERQDLVAGITTMMDAFILANPTLLARHFRTRPESAVTDWPCSWLDLRPEEVHYDSAMRDRTFNASIVFVVGQGDNDQQMTLLDSIVDAFMDHLDSYPRILSGSAWSDGSWSEESIPLSDDTSTPAVRWTFAPILSKRGRA